MNWDTTCGQQIAMYTIMCELRDQKDECRATSRINFAKATDTDDHANAARHKKKRRRKAVGNNTEEAPTTTRKCLESDRGEGWIKSLEEEKQGLVDMGVIKEGFTMQQLRDMGIESDPIPIVLCHDHRHDEQGDINKLKSRACLQGHSGNMFKGVHFWETFTATPKEDTSRILQAMVLRRKLHRKAGDVKQAYCWAKLPRDKWMIGIPPKGLRLANDKGEELMWLVMANLYGGPASGRNWGLFRD